MSVRASTALGFGKPQEKIVFTEEGSECIILYKQVRPSAALALLHTESRHKWRDSALVVVCWYRGETSCPIHIEPGDIVRHVCCSFVESGRLSTVLTHCKELCMPLHSPVQGSYSLADCRELA